MKKLYTLISILLFFINLGTYSFVPIKVQAYTEYARIINDTTPFYKTEHDTTPLFYLPYTYYVKVLDKNQEFTHVQVHGENGVPGLDGYVPTHLLFYDDLEVITPYLNLDITTCGTAILYQDQELGVQSQYVFAQRKMWYYGHLQTDKGMLYFVSYNGLLGYVEESNILPFTIENHPNKLTFIVQPDENEEETSPSTENQTTDLFGLKTAIIICLLFAGLIALFIALGKRPLPDKTGYYEENEYD